MRFTTFIDGSQLFIDGAHYGDAWRSLEAAWTIEEAFKPRTWIRGAQATLYLNRWGVLRTALDWDSLPIRMGGPGLGPHVHQVSCAFRRLISYCSLFIEYLNTISEGGFDEASAP